MRAKFIELTKFNYKPQLGDVIGVHRVGGLYDHYGIYESDGCIYEFAGPRGDFSKKSSNEENEPISIHTTTLKKFIGKSDNYFTLVFPEKYGLPGKLEFQRNNAPVRAAIVAATKTVSIAASLAKIPGAAKDYHLYSGEETVERAKQRLGETGYWLPTNNCEHYALWCKTDLKTSHQVEELLKTLGSVTLLGPALAGAAGPHVIAGATSAAVKTMVGAPVLAGAAGSHIITGAASAAVKTMASAPAIAGAKTLVGGTALMGAKTFTGVACPPAAAVMVVGTGVHMVYKLVKKSKDS